MANTSYLPRMAETIDRYEEALREIASCEARVGDSDGSDWDDAWVMGRNQLATIARKALDG